MNLHSSNGTFAGFSSFYLQVLARDTSLITCQLHLTVYSATKGHTLKFHASETFGGENNCTQFKNGWLLPKLHSVAAAKQAAIASKMPDLSKTKSQERRMLPLPQESLIAFFLIVFLQYEE